MNDILALIKEREAQLRGELTKLKEMREVYAGTDGTAETAADQGAPAETILTPRHHMSTAARKRQSARMKAVWAARRKKNAKR